VAPVPHLQVLGVEPEVGVGALERAGPERLDLLVELPADPRDLVLAHMDAQLGDQVVDLPGRDPVHVGLHDDAQQRLLGTFARLEEAREVALAAPLPRHRQLDLADPGRPGPRAVAVAVGRPPLAHLTLAGADLGRDLRLHQLGGHGRDRLAQEVGVLGDQGPGDDLGGRHALALGHRGASFRQSTCRSTDESGARGGRNFLQPLHGLARYTTSSDVTLTRAPACGAWAPQGRRLAGPEPSRATACGVPSLPGASLRGLNPPHPHPPRAEVPSARQ
jgi:hypothetical protein